jgi:uncharacterized membrane protein YdjX (TVP38/TMEM64 family)
MLRFALIAAFLVVTVIVPFVIWGDALEQGFSQTGAVAWLEGQGRFAWLAAMALMISDLALPIPSSAVMGALGLVYGAVLGGLISVAGVVLAGLVGYGLCRWLGRPLARWLVGEAPLSQGGALFDHRGGWLVALSRWIPVLAEVVVCLAGLTAMPFPKFLLALVCGALPLGFVYAGIGATEAERPMLALGLCILLPAVLWLGARLALRLPGLGASPRTSHIADAARPR